MLTNSPFLPFPDAPYGCISVPSSVECARHTPSSEADLSSKIHRKVVRAVWVYIRSLISRVRPAHSFVGSESILENPSQSCDAPFGWFPPGCAQQVFCCTTRLPQPLRAWVVLSVMDVIPPHSDGCDISPTETLRNPHLTGSRYLLQLADGSLDI